MKTIGIFIIWMLCAVVGFSQAKYEKENRSQIKQALQEDAKAKGDKLFGALNNKETAIAVAEVYLFKIYGKEHILSEKPYNTKLIDGYWIITGTLPEGYVGGCFYIIINSKNGQVIRLFHGK